MGQGNARLAEAVGEAQDSFPVASKSLFVFEVRLRKYVFSPNSLSALEFSLFFAKEFSPKSLFVPEVRLPNMNSLIR
jgi:hypothetical protein